MPDLVMILWEDSTRPTPAWQWVSQSRAQTPVRIRSVGWLIHDDDDAKTIVPNLSQPDDDGDRQMCGGMIIPTRAILRIEKLNCPFDDLGNVFTNEPNLHTMVSVRAEGEPR